MQKYNRLTPEGCGMMKDAPAKAGASYASLSLLAGPVLLAKGRTSCEESIGLVVVVWIESTNYMETKEFCGAAWRSKSFKDHNGILSDAP